MFVNFPRWSEDAPVSVAEVKDGKPVVPRRGTGTAAQRQGDEVDPKTPTSSACRAVVADGQDRLWVSIAAAPAMAHVIKDGPKLVGIGPEDQPGREGRSRSTPARCCRPVHQRRADRARTAMTAYLTGFRRRGGALIVVDLDSGSAKRVLSGHATTPCGQERDRAVRRPAAATPGRPGRRVLGRRHRPVAGREDAVLAGIKGQDALQPATDALTGWATAAFVPEMLSDRTLDSKIVTVGENGPADGLLIARKDGRMYVTLAAGQCLEGPRPHRQGERPHHPGAGPAIAVAGYVQRGPDGTIYVTTFHIQDSADYQAGRAISLPTELGRSVGIGRGDGRHSARDAPLRFSRAVRRAPGRGAFKLTAPLTPGPPRCRTGSPGRHATGRTAPLPTGVRAACIGVRPGRIATRPRVAGPCSTHCSSTARPTRRCAPCGCKPRRPASARR